MTETPDRLDCSCCGREDVPADPGLQTECAGCLGETCPACALPYGDAAGGRRPVLCAACAKTLGLASTYGLDATWSDTLYACCADSAAELKCPVCGTARRFADAIATWKVCAACATPVCPACLDPFETPPRCRECKADAEREAGDDPVDLSLAAPASEGRGEAEGDDGADDEAADGGRSPLDLDGLIGALDTGPEPGKPYKPLLEDLSDDPNCAHEKTDPERHHRMVRAFYQVVTGKEPPPPPEREPPAPASLPLSAEKCIVCRTRPRSREIAARLYSMTFPCTLCGRTICQACRENRKTDTWNIFCCPDCLADPRKVIVKSNPFRCWFEGSPPKERGGITLCRRAAGGLLGWLGVE